MGAGGGRMPAKEIGGNAIRHAPTEKPPFTVGQLKNAVPPHCFERSVTRSFSYLIYDLIIVSALLYLALYQIPRLPSPYNYLAWPLYWICQGSVCGGIWVIAHECGHHAFSDYQLLDDIIGFIFHSALLVPYFSFKHSHHHHHSNTASLERDESFVPWLKTSMPWFFKYLNNPAGRIWSLFVNLTVGWTLYLAFNFRCRPYPRFTSHFDPYGPIYSDRERAQIFMSDAGIIAVVYALYKMAVAFSLGWVIRVYGVPLLVVNGGLVMIIFLHHTHPALPFYDSTEWNWLRGALATVDRDYGIFNKVLHNITDTHVAHHLFPTMPHYNAMEATKAIKPVLGEYYQYDATPVYKALWREAKECVYVESESEKRKGVYWYNNKF